METTTTPIPPGDVKPGDRLVVTGETHTVDTIELVTYGGVIPRSGRGENRPTRNTKYRFVFTDGTRHELSPRMWAMRVERNEA